MRKIRQTTVYANGLRRKDFWYEVDGRRRLLSDDEIEGLPLYGIEHLGSIRTEKELSQPVVVCEGEAAAEAARKRGFIAVGTMTGALRVPSYASLVPLLTHEVVLWPDADDVGRQHMAHLAMRLHRLGHRKIRWLFWPGAPAHADIVGFTGSDEELRSLLTTAKKWEPSKTLSAVHAHISVEYPNAPGELTEHTREVSSSANRVFASAQFRREARALRLAAEAIDRRVAATGTLPLEDRVLIRHLLRTAQESFGSFRHVWEGSGSSSSGTKADDAKRAQEAQSRNGMRRKRGRTRDAHLKTGRKKK